MSENKKIQYPYLPEGRDIKYVPQNDEFMSAAQKIAEESGCTKQATGAVLVKSGKIIGKGSNAGRKIDVCPRVLNGSKTGEDYHYCKEYCEQEGHSEAMAVKDARKKGKETEGADLYLYGHWWCCKPCWDAMIGAGVENVYLLEGSENKFNFSATIGKIYISGALTVIDANKNLKSVYEKIARVCSNFCSNVYVPHLGGTDPVKDPSVDPQVVWHKDHREVASSDLIIAYVGTPSLGVGAELEIARITASNLIIWWFKGEKVSRMALGNPAVSHKIEAKDENDLAIKLTKILKQY
ncbi:MAG: deaminase [Candidatus Moranbacteria bacterium]|nr:deaminase [Candidatus Moranbacteria bacterium]